MHYAEFVARVQEYAALEDAEEARRGLDAVLETLGERLPRTGRKNLAAQLPNELKESLLKRDRTDRFVLRGFYNRVAARAGVGHPEAIKLARAVMLAVREAISPGEWQDVVSDFPDEYDDLFERRPDDPVSMCA